jgi:hypothetical protein
MSFFNITDKRPVLVFEDEDKAQDLKKSFCGADLSGNKNHVILPTPSGLERVCGAQNGETAYSKPNFLYLCGLR